MAASEREARREVGGARVSGRRELDERGGGEGEGGGRDALVGGDGIAARGGRA